MKIVGAVSIGIEYIKSVGLLPNLVWHEGGWLYLIFSLSHLQTLLCCACLEEQHTIHTTTHSSVYLCEDGKLHYCTEEIDTHAIVQMTPVPPSTALRP